MEPDSNEESAVTISQGMVPFARATVIDGKIRLADWSRHLQVVTSEHGAYRGAAERGVFIVDLARDVDANDVREMFVIELAGVHVPDHVIETIASYADFTGYQRLWWSRGMRDLQGLVPFGYQVETACGLCGTVHREDSVRWWHWISRAGRFPTQCWICANHTLDSWTLSTEESSSSHSDPLPKDPALDPREPWSSEERDGGHRQLQLEGGDDQSGEAGA